MERFGRNTLWLSLVIVGLVVIGALLGLEPRGGQMSAGELAAPASASSGAGSSGDEVVVELKGMRFTPAEIHVTPGTTIRFVNRDPITHNVVNARPETLGRERELFRSPEIQPRGSWTLTLQEEGTYDILCDLAGHYLAGMVGKIVVSSDSRAVTHGETHTAPVEAPRIARDPTDLPAPVKRDGPAHVVVELETVEKVGTLADGLAYTYWTFNGTVPGPMIRVRQGDTVEIRLTNNPSSTQVHSIDLHAVNGPGGGGTVTQVAPGETKAFQFKALNPGVFVYHCATPPVPTHIANGIYGLIVVEPPGGLAPVDHEFYVMQGEVYTDVRPGAVGHAVHNPSSMWEERPNFVVFNGQFQALTGEHAMQVRVGDRVRIFVGNGGPNLISSFHVIGEVFDVVHAEAASEPKTNVQTTVIPAGGAAWVEFTVDVPGEYTLVDHALGRALDKGALAVIVAEGDENPSVFRALP